MNKVHDEEVQPYGGALRAILVGTELGADVDGGTELGADKPRAFVSLTPEELSLLIEYINREAIHNCFFGELEDTLRKKLENLIKTIK